MMTLGQLIKSSIGWCISLNVKFIRSAPLSTFLVQTLNLTSQVLMLLAFFLPLKVIILLGSEHIPNYYPQPLHEVPRNYLIFTLSASAGLCYMLHVACELTTNFICRKLAAKILLRNGKLNLHENQEKLAIHAYTRFSRAMASGIFFTLSIILLAVVYPILSLVISAYVISCTILLTLLFNSSKSFQKKLANHYSPIVNFCSAFGFLITFFFLVIDFLYLNQSNILIAVLAIIILRQGLQRLVGMVIDITGLRIQHRQLNTLFYSSQPPGNHLPHAKGLDRLDNTESRNTLIEEVLRQMKFEATTQFDVEWHQLALRDIYGFKITAPNSKAFPPLLVKIFGDNLSSHAVEEHILFSMQDGLPALPFKIQYKTENIYCHVFELNQSTKLTNREYPEAIKTVGQQLLMLEPSHELIAYSEKKRSFLEQRLNQNMVNSLLLACSNEEEKNNIKKISSSLDFIKAILSSLPRQIVPADITTATLLSSPPNYVVSHWSNWRIEAAGCGWPTTQKDKLFEALNSCQRASLSNVAANKVWLAALIHMLERCITGKDYSAALALTYEIIACLDLLSTPLAVDGAIV